MHNKNQNLRLRFGRAKARPFGGRYVCLREYSLKITTALYEDNKYGI